MRYLKKIRLVRKGYKSFKLKKKPVFEALRVVIDPVINGIK